MKNHKNKKCKASKCLKLARIKKTNKQRLEEMLYLKHTQRFQDDVMEVDTCGYIAAGTNEVERRKEKVILGLSRV